MLACQRSRIEENTYFSCIFFIFWHKYLNLVGLPYINFNEFFVALEIATPGKPSKKRKPDDTWEHAIPLDEKGEATRCRYCGFVSRCGGIARLQAHLGGGNLAMQVDFCPNVPPEIRNLMAGGKKKYKNKSKGVLQGKALLQVNLYKWNIVREVFSYPIVLLLFTGTPRASSEVQWGDKQRFVLQETLDEISNTSVKGRLQRLIEEKSGSVEKMRGEVNSLQMQLASMP